jgi:signal recognition particle subunit SRP54
VFEGLQERLEATFRKLRGEGRISEEVLRASLRDIRLALLEGDVNFRVVKAFVRRVEERALGERVLDSLTPAQQVVKIVRDELVVLLGEEGAELDLSGRPSVVLLCGLQGSGKTTTAGKLARRLRRAGRNPLLAAGDLQRAAAVEQLRQVGRAVEVPVLAPADGEDVVALARRAVGEARRGGHDVLLFDTAGRLHVDEELMRQLEEVVAALAPQEVLLTVDAMTGQDAVASAQEFARRLTLTGVILSKLDGDARGGAALSIRTVAQVPIRFVGVGETPDDLELFRPERMAGRITGMGDVLSLIEKAEQGLDADESQRLAERLARRQFTLEDLRDQLRQLRRLGPLSQLVGLLPRTGALRGLDSADLDEDQVRAVTAIIDSMTPQERRLPKIVNASRRRRIARGSGTSVQQVNRLLKQHRQMQKLMKRMKGDWLRRIAG